MCSQSWVITIINMKIKDLLTVVENPSFVDARHLVWKRVALIEFGNLVLRLIPSLAVCSRRNAETVLRWNGLGALLLVLRP